MVYLRPVACCWGRWRFCRKSLSACNQRRPNQLQSLVLHRSQKKSCRWSFMVFRRYTSGQEHFYPRSTLILLSLCTALYNAGKRNVLWGSNLMWCYITFILLSYVFFIKSQALNSLILGARPFWPHDLCQKYGTKAIVKGHQGHTKQTGFVCVLYLTITSK